MPAVPTPLPPGSMTVPLWFGWGEVALVVVLAVLLGVAAFVALAAGRAASGRSEFEAWLESRSGTPTGLSGEKVQSAAAQPSDTPSR